jgi:hypothetical protein
VFSLKYVKVVSSRSPGTLQDHINKILEETNDDLVDVKLSSAFNGNQIVHTAVIMLNNKG